MVGQSSQFTNCSATNNLKHPNFALKTTLKEIIHVINIFNLFVHSVNVINGYDDSIQSMTVAPIIPKSCFDVTSCHLYNLAILFSSTSPTQLSRFIMIQPPFDQFATLTAPATTSSVAPIPTVLPGSEVYQELHDAGKRTLWYVHIILSIQIFNHPNIYRVVTVLMGISSLVFYTLAARAPLVSSSLLYHICSLLSFIHI